jgi:hypothetical protein
MRRLGNSRAAILPLMRLNKSSSCARAVRHRALGHGQDWPHTIGIADVEQHPFRSHAAHRARFKIHYEQRLLAFNLARIAPLTAQSGNDGALVIPKSNSIEIGAFTGVGVMPGIVARS